MKNETLLSSLLLLNPIASLSAQDIALERSYNYQQRQELIDLQFSSHKIVANGHHTSGATYIKMTFYKVDGDYYSYNGKGEMEYELEVQQIGPKGEIEYLSDSYFYVKRLDENTFQLFDCDSSQNCREESSHAIFHIFQTPQGKLLKFKKSSVTEDFYLPITDLKFFQMKR